MEITPSWDVYVCLHAVVLIAQGREREAERRLAAAVRDLGATPRVFAVLAYLAAKAGDLERARLLDAQAKKDRERYARCYYLPLVWGSLAGLRPPHDQLGRAVTGNLDIQAVAPKEESETLRLRRRAEERLARGELDAAYGDIARVVSKYPADGFARRIQARCLDALGEAQAAADDRKLLPFILPPEALKE